MYWRTYGDTLEMIVINPDYNLAGTRVKCKFVVTSLLPGITAQESRGNVLSVVSKRVSVW